MGDRLSEISARLKGVEQLGAVVNAMRGVAAARALQARDRLQAVDGYAATIATALGLLMATRSATAGATAKTGRGAIVLFVAEQGFAGAFTERVLEAAGADLATSDLYLVGTRGIAIAREHGLSAVWHVAMPSHSSGIPRMADLLTEALFAGVASRGLRRIEAIFAHRRDAERTETVRRLIMPLDPAAFTVGMNVAAPLMNLPPDVLFENLTGDYFHAQLCAASLHAFAAENEARMEAMAAARSQIGKQLASLRSTQRQVRQEEITAEIIELATGEAASRRA
jgi:F-type H+-transporting ATPase subunit gamma